MNEELLEHTLCQLNGIRVILIQPMFGTVSHSFVGILNTTKIDFPVKYHFQGEGIASVFYTKDVQSVEDSHGLKVVRLKSPYHYKENYETQSR